MRYTRMVCRLRGSTAVVKNVGGYGKMKKVLVSLPEGVFDLIDRLRREKRIGESNSEVIRNIVVAYLSDQGYFSKMGVIRGIPSSQNEKKK